MHHLAHIALLVNNYDEAARWYQTVLGFTVVEDSLMEEGKRWLRISSGQAGNTDLLLVQAKNAEQTALVGKQCGSRVFLFLHTDQFDQDLIQLKQHSVNILRGPEQQPWGRVLVFEDLYGNRWDLIERIHSV